MHLIILPMNRDCAPRASKADLPSKKKDNPRDRSPIDKSHVPESEMWGLTKTIIRQLCKSQIFHFFRRKQEKPKSKPSLHHYKGVTTIVCICTTTPSGQCANSNYTFGIPVVSLRSQPGLRPLRRLNDPYNPVVSSGLPSHPILHQVRFTVICLCVWLSRTTFLYLATNVEQIYLVTHQEFCL